MLANEPGGARPRRRRWGRAVVLLATATLLPRPGVAADPGGPVPPGGEVSPLPSLLLLPPEPDQRRPRLEALAAHPEIDRVVFYVDGREVGTDGRRPFTVRLRDHTDRRSIAEGAGALRAVAFGRDGTVLAEDSLELGSHPDATSSFEVALSSIEGDPSTGEVEVEIDVEVPPGGSLDRIEVFHNQRTAAVLAGPPFRLRVPTPDASSLDYLRVVAHLADGRSLEDAAPLAAADAAERLDVALVDLFAVVSNRRGEPIQGLGPADFRVVLDDRELAVERFREARQVPLALGLLVDSSESMGPIIDRVEDAARAFLDGTLAPGDEAFLVDVDTVPRMVREMTPSPDELAAAFDDLEAGGYTALYDAILLGLLRLERHPGRRALVVLTDGRDYGSDFGPRRCLRHAERAGVPVYVLSLAGMGGRTNTERNFRLEALARATGGRVLHASTLRGVERAYREIERELRSQYVLGVAADRVLSERELAALAVEVERPGAEVRISRSSER